MAVAPTSTVGLFDLNNPTGLTQPYLALPGSSDVADLNNPQIWQDAAGLFPFFDGDNNVSAGLDPALPSNYATATGAEFARWHSAHQLAYLKDPANQQTVAVPDDETSDGTVVTGIADARYVEFADGVVAFLSADGNRAHVLNNLQPTDIARMSLGDQRILATLSGFQTLIAAPYSLVPDTVTSYPVPPSNSLILLDTSLKARDAAKAIVDELRTIITSSPLYQANQRDTFLSDFSRVGEFYHYLFSEQLALLDLRLEQQGVFDLDNVQELVDQIGERFLRFERYNSITTPTEMGALLSLNMNSSHSPAETIAGKDTTSQGRDIFLRLESTHFEIALQKAMIVNTGTSAGFGNILRMMDNTTGAEDQTFASYEDTFENLVANGPPELLDPLDSILKPVPITRLDGPGILATLQYLENTRNEAEAEGKSEELKQVDRLLQDYSAMQKLLNDTLKIFQPVAKADPDDDPPPEETLTLLNVTSVSELITDDHPAGNYIAAMFDTAVSTASNSGHPEEQDPNGFGYSRPTESIATGSTLNSYAKRVWDSLAINIGEATKLLGQENQVRMDEINQISKAKNRNYDLASNTINKLTELLRAINA